MKNIPKSHPIHRRMLHMRKRLHMAYPKCFMPFGADKVPLKVGIHRDLHHFATGAYEYRDLLNALGDYVTGDHYIRALVAGATRVDLAGNAAGVVSESDAEHAAAILAKRQRRAEAAKREADAAKRKQEAEQRAKIEAEKAVQRKAAQSRPAPRTRTVQVEVIRRRAGGVPGLTRRFG